MVIGKLRHKIAIQSCTVGVGARGQTTRTYAAFASPYAEIIDTGGREFVAGMKLAAEITKLIRIRYLAGLTPRHRVAIGSDYFDINSVVDMTGKREELFLLCKASA